jgi:ferrous iron transport protein B
VFAPQCLSTLAVVRRETNSWRYPLAMTLYLFVLAYGAAFATYRLTLWWGG